MATRALFTVDDYVRLPESVGGQDVRYELVEGELVAVSPTTPLHNDVRDTLLVAMRNFLAGKNVGRAFAEQAFQLSASTVRIPDISFVRVGRVIDPHRIPDGAPDLAVEVLSPSNTPREIDERISDYFSAGCQRVWVIYPEEHEVYVHGLAGVTRRRRGELLEDAELLPGFSVRVSELFNSEGQG